MAKLEYLRRLRTNQVGFHLKEQWLTALCCFLALFVTGVISHLYAHDQAPVLVASMGASAVILYVLPNSPLAQPWPLVMGHLLSALIGVAVSQTIPTLVYAAATAVGLSVFMMLLIKCVHPPSAATALSPILVPDPTKPLDFMYVLMPVGLNVLIMLGLAILLNSLLLDRDYPSAKPLAHNRPDPRTTAKTPLTEDIMHSVADFEGFVDVSIADLAKLFTAVQLRSYQRKHRHVTCGELMHMEVMTLDYDTEVEVAWALMQAQHLQVMPVLDRAKHVIGIVTAHDFLKFVNLKPYASIQKNFLAFIGKTNDLSTTKPEAIGHIMTRKVATLKQSSSIIEAAQIMSTHGHRYLPIVDDQEHFVGMVFQVALMQALFENVLLQE